MNRTNWLNHINNPQLFEDEDKYFEFTNDLMQKLGKVTNKTQLLEHKNKQLQARIDKAIEYIGNGNLGIPRKTRDKFIKILKGEDKE